MRGHTSFSNEDKVKFSHIPNNHLLHFCMRIGEFTLFLTEKQMVELANGANFVLQDYHESKGKEVGK